MQTTRDQPEASLDIHRGINAVSEAFNSVLKVEYVHRHAFTTRTEARIRIATWITDFYNTRRLHSVCGFKSPIDYEHDYRAALTEELAA
ncbi:integrase core domain-containing protein [Streptomyces hirsutus]|uniref:integrase core domain-containing protein n=1 Tax=Streptomyces hirsutus TaxID=35620 RepID=UPI0036C2D757